MKSKLMCPLLEIIVYLHHPLMKGCIKFLPWNGGLKGFVDMLLSEIRIIGKKKYFNKKSFWEVF